MNSSIRTKEPISIQTTAAKPKNLLRNIHHAVYQHSSSSSFDRFIYPPAHVGSLYIRSFRVASSNPGLNFRNQRGALSSLSLHFHTLQPAVFHQSILSQPDMPVVSGPSVPIRTLRPAVSSRSLQTQILRSATSHQRPLFRTLRPAVSFLISLFRLSTSMPVDLAHRILFRFFKLALAKLVSPQTLEGRGAGLAWLGLDSGRTGLLLDYVDVLIR